LPFFFVRFPPPGAGAGGGSLDIPKHSKYFEQFEFESFQNKTNESN